MKNKKEKKIKRPNVGDKIYVDSSFYISRGEDDFAGGLATISNVKEDISAGEKTLFISIDERPFVSYNYEMLVKYGEQERLKKKFGKQKAHPDPDINTPWIEPGDTVRYN